MKHISWSLCMAAFVGVVGAEGAASLPEVEILDFTSTPFDVLLTGFGPFLNFTDNPTGAIARRVGSSCRDVTILPDPRVLGRKVQARLHICWHAHVLPVNRSGALWTVQHLKSSMKSDRVAYQAVIHTGFEDSARGLKLEVAASNTMAKDNGAPGSSRAVQGAPHLLVTTVNTGWLSFQSMGAAAVASQGLLARERELWSRDPGSYYCNEVYYRTLQYIRSEAVVVSTGALLPAMFVHVPNRTESTIAGDVEVVEQVAGHALWAALLAGAPGPAAWAAPVPTSASSLLLGRALAGGVLLGVLSTVLLVLVWHRGGARAGPLAARLMPAGCQA